MGGPAAYRAARVRTRCTGGAERGGCQGLTHGARAAAGQLAAAPATGPPHHPVRIRVHRGLASTSPNTIYGPRHTWNPHALFESMHVNELNRTGKAAFERVSRNPHSLFPRAAVPCLKKTVIPHRCSVSSLPQPPFPTVGQLPRTGSREPEETGAALGQFHRPSHMALDRFATSVGSRHTS